MPTYARIDACVHQHPKVLRAGPEAAWLWLAAILQSQFALTDGFVAAETLHLLVPSRNARRLASRLVDVGLFDEVEGGWRVHDYLAHNRSASEIRRISKERALAGAKGAAALQGQRAGQSGQLAEQVAEQVAEQDSGFARHVEHPETETSTATAAAARTSHGEDDLARFRDAYPASGRRGGYRVESAFVDAVRAVGIDALLDALANHVQSDQWQRGMVPGMDRWLLEQRWTVRLDPPAAVPTRAESGACPADQAHDPPCRTWQEHTTRTLDEARAARQGAA